MTDSLHPISQTPQPAAEWRAFADLMLDTLCEPAYRNWTCLAQPREVTSDSSRKMGTHSAGKTKNPAPDAAEDPHDVNSLLDWIEREDTSDCLPPCPDTVPGTTSYRPRVSVTMAVLRLARTFATPEGFRNALATPGEVNVLSGVETGQGDLMTRLLDAVIWRDEICPGKPDVHVTSIDDAVTPGLRPEKNLFRDFSEGFGRALEHGQPVLIVGGADASRPASLRLIVTQTIALAHLDPDMVLALLARVYPEYGLTAAEICERLSADDIKQVSAQALTLATRARTPDEALSWLSRTRESPDDCTPGLSEFPLAPDIREPIEQMLADMKAWKSGEISWDDVSRGLLLTGPPGCGKTEIPRLLAREADVEVRASSLSKWQSAGARSSDLLQQMRRFFTEAAKTSPCIVFIDELDAIGDRDRPQDHNSSWTDSVVAGLLECLDGFDGAPGVVVMGATNHPHKIDAALRRPGRFDRTLTMRQPTPDLLAKAFRWHLRGALADEDLDPLSGIATGMTGAEIAATVRDARATARRALRALAFDDLTSAITERRPPLDPSLRWQVAIHECGHAIVAYATGRATPYLLSLHDAGGEAGMTAAPSRLHLDEMQADLACLLAGRAAERLILGRPSGGAGGPENSDLAHASRLAAGIELSYGLGETGCAWMGPPDVAVARLRFDRDLHARVEAHLDQAESHAMDVLQANRDLLEETARTLSQRGSLSGECLQGFMDRVTACKGPENREAVRSDCSLKGPQRG